MGHFGSRGGGSSFGPPRHLMDRYGLGFSNYGIFGPPVLPEIVFDPDDPFGCDPNTRFGDDDGSDTSQQDASQGQQADGSDQSQPQDDGSGGSGGVLDAVQQVASGVADMIAPPTGPSGPSGGTQQGYGAPPPPPQQGYPMAAYPQGYPHPHHHHHHRRFIPPPSPPAYIPPPLPRENVWRHMADYRDRRFERREPERRFEPGYARPYAPLPPFPYHRPW